MCSPAGALSQANPLVRAALEEPGEGRVLVVDGGASKRYGVPGACAGRCAACFVKMILFASSGATQLRAAWRQHRRNGTQERLERHHHQRLHP